LTLILFSIFFILFFAISCKPLKKLGLKNYPPEQISILDFKKLNGSYSNYPDTANGKIVDDAPHNRHGYHLSLFNQFSIGPESGVPEVYKNEVVELTFTSNRKGIISLYKNDSLLHSEKIRGSIKRNYFYVRPKILVLPFVPILFGYQFQKLRIGISNENLIVDYNSTWFLCFFGFGSARHGYYSSVYNKISE